jgi:hypothetical protein
MSNVIVTLEITKSLSSRVEAALQLMRKKDAPTFVPADAASLCEQLLIKWVAKNATDVGEL